MGATPIIGVPECNRSRQPTLVFVNNEGVLNVTWRVKLIRPLQ